MPIARPTAALAGLIVMTAAVPAVADTPKQGTYIDTAKQAYIVVTAGRNTIKSFQADCQATRSDGTVGASGSVYLSKTKRIKVKPSGAFSYDGVALVPGSSGKPSQVKLKISGRFTGGKVKGTYSAGADSICQPATFSGRYYGKNPQG